MYRLGLFLCLAILYTSCIGDDIIADAVPETLRITNAIDSIGVDSTHQFETRYTNNIGEIEEAQIIWQSSAPGVLEISNTGLARGIAEGQTIVTAEVTLPDGESLMEELPIAVSEAAPIIMDPVDQERTGIIAATSFYTLEGNFTLSQDGDQVTLSFGDDYRADTALPGLYVYLTNNPNTINNAFEIGAVSVFNGAHEYNLSGVDLFEFDYVLYFCKPFNVKVGDGEISE